MKLRLYLSGVALAIAVLATTACSDNDPPQIPTGVQNSSSDAVSQTTTPDPTEPPLINTPSPVTNLAPDFTLPSVQGTEYTLSQFRGDKPVAVVFYRAYW
jgi:hypothetical protein